MDIQKIRELAREALDYFVTHEGEFYLQDGAPKWVVELVRRAHEDTLPNDWRFRFTYIALTNIENAESEDELDTPDIFPSETWSELLDWLQDDPHALSFVDDVFEQGFVTEFRNFFELLQFAQYHEMRGVHDLVLEFLQEMAEQEQEVAHAEA